MCINRLRLYLLRRYLRVSGTSIACIGNDAPFGNIRLEKTGADYIVVVPVSDVNKPALNAINYSRTISDNVVAVHVCIDSVDGNKIKKQWDTYVKDVPLVILDSLNGSIVCPLIDFIDKTINNHRNTVVVAIPELVLKKWWHCFLHNKTSKLIKEALQGKKGVIITSVPFKINKV